MAAPGAVVDWAKNATGEEVHLPPTAVRPLALVAILGGAVFVVLGVVQPASPGQANPFSGTSDYLVEALRAWRFERAREGRVILAGEMSVREAQGELRRPLLRPKVAEQPLSAVRWIGA